MDKNYEAVKEILEDQMKKIAKKGDISPQELDSLYKASAIVLDFETKEAMKKAENRGFDMESENLMKDKHSNHYPWWMFNSMTGGDVSNRGNSYGPVWNQELENRSMHELQSNDYSRRRGVDGTGNRSYNSAYEGAYDGSYEGAYEGAYDGAYDNDNSYRRGRDQRTGRYVSRDRGYSRSIDKERMIGKLEDMMDDAPTEKERRVLQQCVEKLEKH